MGGWGGGGVTGWLQAVQTSRQKTTTTTTTKRVLHSTCFCFSPLLPLSYDTQRSWTCSVHGSFSICSNKKIKRERKCEFVSNYVVKKKEKRSYIFIHRDTTNETRKKHGNIWKQTNIKNESCTLLNMMTIYKKALKLLLQLNRHCQSPNGALHTHHRPRPLCYGRGVWSISDFSRQDFFFPFSFFPTKTFDPIANISALLACTAHLPPHLSGPDPLRCRNKAMSY